MTAAGPVVSRGAYAPEFPSQKANGDEVGLWRTMMSAYLSEWRRNGFGSFGGGVGKCVEAKDRLC